MKINILIVLGILLMASCQEKTNVKGNEKGFAGLTAYFNREIAMLENSDKSLEKAFVNNGKQEQIKIDKPNWKNELRPFTEIISVHPASLNSFIIDSMRIESASILKYTSKDDRQALKSLTVFSHLNLIDSILIIKQVSNSYYSSTDTLIYRGSGNFRIAVENNPYFGKKMALVFEGKSLPWPLQNNLRKIK